MHPFTTKVLSKPGTERNFLNLKKGICEKLTVNNISQGHLSFYCCSTAVVPCHYSHPPHHI